MSKAIKLCICSAIAVLMVDDQATAQYVDFTISVVKEELSIQKKRIWVEGKYTHSKEGRYVDGVQILARENIPVLVELEWSGEPKSNDIQNIEMPEARWLNDGTSNYEKSILFEDNKAWFRLDHRSKLISELSGNPKQFAAWVFLVEETEQREVGKTSESEFLLKITYL